MDIKALLINTIRFSWEVRSVFRVQGWRARGSAAVCVPASVCTRRPFNILPFKMQCSKLEGGKKRTVSTAELIFTVYREYTGISRPKKANLASVTQRIMCPSPLNVHRKTKKDTFLGKEEPIKMNINDEHFHLIP